VVPVRQPLTPGVRGPLPSRRVLGRRPHAAWRAAARAPDSRAAQGVPGGARGVYLVCAKQAVPRARAAIRHRASNYGIWMEIDTAARVA
jgi:hypothetical protein